MNVAEAAETKDEIKALSLKLRHMHRVVIHHAKIHAERIFNAKLRGIIKRSETVEKHLEDPLAEHLLRGNIKEVACRINAFSAYYQFT